MNEQEVKKYMEDVLRISKEIVLESKYLIIAERSTQKNSTVVRMCQTALVPHIIHLLEKE